MLNLAAKVFLVLLTTLTILPVTVSAQPKKTDEAAAALVAEARAAWQKDNGYSAIESLKKAIALDPNNVATHTELADIYIAMKYYDEARLAIAEALRLKPDYAPAHHRKAILLRHAGDYEGSIAEARVAISLRPDDQTTAYSYVTIGRALVKQKKFAEAEAEFRNAASVYEENIKRKPNDFEAYAALGDLLFQLQDYDKAESAYRRAFELNSKDSSIAINLARVVDNQGKKDEAIRLYQEYFRLDPKTHKSSVDARIKFLETNPLSTVVSYLLVDAAENGKLSNVKSLIAKGANVNFRDRWRTPLYSAAEGGYSEVVRLLLDQGAKDEDAAALTAAYEGGHTEIEKLLERAAPLPLSPEGLDRLLRAAIRKGDGSRFAALLQNPTQKQANELLLYTVSEKKATPVEIVRTLLKKGANPNEPTKGTTALMYAARNGHFAIAQLLLSEGAQVNTQTNEGTALILAVRNAHVEVVTLLLEAGANVTATWGTADHVLIMAANLSKKAEDGSISDPGAEIVRLLLGKGADPNARGQYGQTALMHANTSAKVNLLIANRAEINAKDEQGKTALMESAGRGHSDVVRVLLDKGADINAVDQAGNNALLRSLQADIIRDVEEFVKRRLEVARVLLQAKGLNINAQNLDGETALMRAVRLENVEMIKALLSKGADANRSDVFGDTALTLAFDKGNREIEELLPKTTFKGQPRNVLNAFLRVAIEKKDEAMVTAVLAEGADPNHEFGIGYTHKDIKRTVLVLAALMGHPGIVQLLLDKGANVNAEGLIHGSEHGLEYGNALKAAESAQNAEVAAILRKAMKPKPVPD